MWNRLSRAFTLGSVGILLLCSLHSPLRADNLEPNDTTDDAYPLENGVEIGSWISTDEDLDWYTFETFSPGTITVQLHTLPDDYDLILFWWNRLTERAETFDGWRSDNPGSADEEILVDTERTGVFYILVFGFAGAFGEYETYHLYASWPTEEQSLPPTVTLISPNGGETWPAASRQTVVYEATDPDTPPASLLIGLDVTTNSGSTWWPIVASTTNQGEYTWTTPDIGTSRARVRVIASDGVNEATDISDGDFEITTKAPVVTLLTPNGGEHFETSEAVTIQYIAIDEDTPDGLLEMEFEYSTNGGITWNLMRGGPHVNTGSHRWYTFPYMYTTLGRVRVIASDGQNYGYDASDANFSITQAPSIELTSPIGGGRWVAGTEHEITYSATDRDSPDDSLLISFRYSFDSGDSWIDIALGQPNTGSYSWTIPDTPTSCALMRVGASDGRHWGWDSTTECATISGTPEGDNVLSLPDIMAWSGHEIEVALGLANASTVQEIYTVVAFDSSVVTYLEGTVTERAEGMSYSAEVRDGHEIDLSLLYPGQTTMPPGAGPIATLVFQAIGDPGESTPTTLSETGLWGQYARPLRVITEPGSIEVIELPAPRLHLCVLRNPGRARSLQVLLTSDQLLEDLIVEVDDDPVTMKHVSESGLYRGAVHLPPAATGATVRATGSNGQLVGMAETRIEF